MKLFRRRISSVKSKICHGDYILFDGSDIQKKSVKRISKSQKYQLVYECGAIKVQNKIKGKIYDLWLVVTKRTNGGYCWFLTRSPKESIVEVITEAFTAYGFRWKIEEYYRLSKNATTWRYPGQNIRRVTKHVGSTNHRDEHHLLIAAHEVITCKWGKNAEQRTYVRTMQFHLLQNQYDYKSIAGQYDTKGFPSSNRYIS